MEKIKAYLRGNTITSNSTEAYTLYEKSSFGEKKEDKIQYSFTETLFLIETHKMVLIFKEKELKNQEAFSNIYKIDKRIYLKYPIFKDLRKKGYIVKTALKFGADFRVYEKGKKPGKTHAKWIIFADHESKKLTWHEFSAKNRVAHSTKKNLLIAIIDEEEGILYYEIKWIKP